MKKFLLSLVMLFTAYSIFAYNFKSGDLCYNIISDNEVAVTRESGLFSENYSRLTSVVIQCTVHHNGKKYNVVAIDDCAFCETNITYVLIPETVTHIGDGAFSGCSKLAMVEFVNPESITSIDGYAFALTPWYENQPDGVMYIGRVLYGYHGEMPVGTAIAVKDGTISIANYAFFPFYGVGPSRSRDNLTSITIPNSVTHIGRDAFCCCSKLVNVDITKAENITNIGEEAFYGTPWYENQPDGVVYIGRVLYGYHGEMPVGTAIAVKEGIISINPDVFSGCTSLTSITIPNSVTSIEDKTFYECSGLTSVVIGDGVTSIGEEAFYECSGLTSVVIGDGVTSIGEEAFYKCSGLTSITIPNGVKGIGRKAFCEANSNDIVIGRSVEYIEDYAFSLERAPKTITCMAVVPISALHEEAFSRDMYEHSTLYVPSKSLPVYKTHGVWGKFQHIVAIADDDSEEGINDLYDNSNTQQSHQKVIKDGQVMILCDGNYYNILGQKCE